MTLYAVRCPCCRQTFYSNLDRDRTRPEFYSARPWVCFWCRREPGEGA